MACGCTDRHPPSLKQPVDFTEIAFPIFSGYHNLRMQSKKNSCTRFLEQFPIALSTMATQCSTNSLPGAPAFVAFAAGSGILWLWRYAPNISWLWWNVIGFLVAYAAGYVISLIFPAPPAARLSGTLYRRDETQRAIPRRNWRPCPG